MSATYGVLRSDTGSAARTLRGNRFVEATAQSEHVRAIVTVRSEDGVRIELRATDDRNDSGRLIASLMLYPADDESPMALMLDPYEGLLIINDEGEEIVLP